MKKSEEDRIDESNFFKERSFYGSTSFAEEKFGVFSSFIAILTKLQPVIYLSYYRWSWELVGEGYETKVCKSLIWNLAGFLSPLGLKFAFY